MTNKFYLSLCVITYNYSNKKSIKGDKLKAMMNLKNIILLLSFPVILISFLNCGSKKNMEQQLTFKQDPPFVIEDAYYQNWAGGVQEAGKGVNLHVNLKSIEKDVVIMNFYFRNQVLESKFTKQAPNQYVAYWRMDTNTDYIMHEDEMQEAKNIPRASFPFTLKKDEAVIEYWFGGDRFFYKLTDISAKQMISYPGAKPTD